MDTVFRTPRMDLIDIDFAREDGRALILAGPGAVAPGSKVFVANVELGEFIELNADEHGGFSAETIAAPGTNIVIKHDASQTANYIPGEFDWLLGPGVLIRVPLSEMGDGQPFGGGGRLCCGDDPASFAVVGRIQAESLQPGQKIKVSGRVTVFANTEPEEQGSVWFVADIIGDAQGRHIGPRDMFSTNFLTPTNLPIIRGLGSLPLEEKGLGAIPFSWVRGADALTGEFEGILTIPDDFTPGTYTLHSFVGGFGENPPTVEGLLPGGTDDPSVGTFTVGDPAPVKLATTLLADTISEASRGGILALDDVGQWDIGPMVAARHQPVIPRRDATGVPWRYQLELFVPLSRLPVRTPSRSPAIPFVFSDSELTVRITGPGDTDEILGPAPLTRLSVNAPRTPWGDGLCQGSSCPNEIPQLMGSGDTFTFQFPVDGDYIVELDGHIFDQSGRRYAIGGIYDVTVANVLDIEPALVPGTPFEIGNALPVGLTIYPGFPADVDFTVLQIEPDGEETRITYSGQANQNGWWDGDGNSFNFERHGEYRVDIEARYKDPAGNLWAGRMTFGSAVATTDARFVAHGRRGADKPFTTQAWLFASSVELEAEGHWQFPYFNGDVIWGDPDNDKPGNVVFFKSSFQPIGDGHRLLDRAIEQAERFSGNFPDVPFDRAVSVGQIPLVTAPAAEDGSRGALPEEINLWTYSYGVASRPGVRVREFIVGDDAGAMYWGFNDAFQAQSGSGIAGDLPGDIKFMYIANVIRDSTSGEGLYGIHGSGWVHMQKNDPLPSRVMPPFRGAAGGPDGGPLLTVHGREVDLLFVPMGVRPGAVLETGQSFRMAGPIMPTLPSMVDYRVVAPDGSIREFSGRANAVGYYYQPEDDFVVDQAGLWTVELLVTHDGDTSAGTVEPPFPTGGPLTPEPGVFRFVVEDPAEQRLNVVTDLATLAPWQWNFLINEAKFAAQLPDGFEAVNARVIVTMPGVVLVDEEIEPRQGWLRWDLDAFEMNRLASNFDAGDGFYDTVTVTFFAQDASGKTTAGTIVTHGARLPVAPPSLN